MAATAAGTRVLESARKNHAKSVPTWALYLVVGVFPFALAAFVALDIFYLHPSFELTIPDYPDYITKAIPYFLVSIILELVISQMEGKQVYRFNDATNSVFMGLFQLLTGIFIKSFNIFPYGWINAHYRLVDLEPNMLTWLAMFVVVEFGYYWMHRFAHEWNLLWAGHSVHHSSNDYNLSTALRQGFFQPFFSWVFYLPWAFLFPLDLFAFHTQYNTLYQFWIHTQMIGKLPWPVELVFNTPSHHRVHHGRNPQYIDKNYGGTLIVFDRIFGTFEPEQEVVVYGVTHGLDTWSPFALQLQQFVETYHTFKTESGLLNRLRVLLDRGPGFNFEVLYPHEVANPPPPPTPATAHKHNAFPRTLCARTYCYVQCFVAMCVCLYPLLNTGMPLPALLAWVAFCLFVLSSTSAVADCSHMAVLVETIRLIGTCHMAYYFFPRPVFVAACVYGVVTFVWLWAAHALEGRHAKSH